jgi:hypothetical protein
MTRPPDSTGALVSRPHASSFSPRRHPLDLVAVCDHHQPPPPALNVAKPSPAGSCRSLAHWLLIVGSSMEIRRLPADGPRGPMNMHLLHSTATAAITARVHAGHNASARAAALEASLDSQLFRWVGGRFWGAPVHAHDQPPSATAAPDRAAHDCAAAARERLPPASAAAQAACWWRTRTCVQSSPAQACSGRALSQQSPPNR